MKQNTTKPMRVLTKNLGLHIESLVTVFGWVHRIRELGGISFLLLRDRTGIAQLVWEPGRGAGEAGGTTVGGGVTAESVVRADGRVVKNDKAPGGYEVRITSIQVMSRAETPLPYQPNKGGAGLETTLDHRTLSLRNPRINACFKVQSSILDHFARHLRSHAFTEIKSSKLVAGGTEGGAGLFRVEYFDMSMFLAQSPQFYKQAMVASGMERVFEIGAAYRAEKHETARHLNEYISLDIEMGFIDNIEKLMDIEVDILCAVADGVRRDCAQLIDTHTLPIPDSATLRRAPRIAYAEALRIITREGAGRAFEINPEGERLLCAWAEKNHDTDLLFVYGFPIRKRPFYTRPDGTSTHSFDCLFRGVEITTGGLRIHDYASLQANIVRFGLRVEELSHYLDIFRYGCPPHGGFAIGLERLTQKFCNLGSVKEASLFPRDRSRTSP